MLYVSLPYFGPRCSASFDGFTRLLLEVMTSMRYFLANERRDCWTTTYLNEHNAD